jgi:peptidoglycan hydrolase CwlO-like protein
MNRDPGDSALDQAVKRLDRAIAQLEQRLSKADGGLFGEDRARLAAELDDSRAREKALEAAGAEASAALGRAIAEIQAALEQGADAATEDEPVGEEA